MTLPLKPSRHIKVLQYIWHSSAGEKKDKLDHSRECEFKKSNQYQSQDDLSCQLYHQMHDQLHRSSYNSSTRIINIVKKALIEEKTLLENRIIQIRNNIEGMIISDIGYIV